MKQKILGLGALISLALNLYFFYDILKVQIYNMGIRNGINQGQTAVLSELTKQYESGKVELIDAKGKKIVLVPQK